MHIETRETRLISAAAMLLLITGFAGTVFAGPQELEDAVQQYYAGNPDQAITTLKPLALGGDMAAQNLLGNITYALSQSGQSTGGEDPLAWYAMAAKQGSADASYALGSVYHNQWLKTQQEEPALLAQRYFQQAADLGNKKALGPLMKLATRESKDPPGNSLEYSNSSFSSKRSQSTTTSQASSKQSIRPSKNPGIADLLARFEPSGDAAADSVELESLLREFSANGGDLSDEKTLTRILTGIGAPASLATDLMWLIENIKRATEPGLAPGSN